MADARLSFLLPNPLMKPESWAPLDESAHWLLPLDIATVAGGPLKARFESLLELDRVAWYLPSKFLSLAQGASVQHEIRSREIESWLQTFPGVAVFSDVESTRAQVLKVQEFSIFSWAEQIFPSLLSELGELALRSEVSAYLLKMHEAENFPWEGLRFFAGNLRQKSPDLAAVAAEDWGRFQALFSPQNEEVEARRLGVDQLILNPTVQILKDSRRESIRLVYRWNGRLHSRDIGWRESYLVDEVSESPKLPRDRLLKMAEIEGEALAKTLGSSISRSFDEALESLIRDHVLLMGLA